MELLAIPQLSARSSLMVGRVVAVNASGRVSRGFVTLHTLVTHPRILVDFPRWIRDRGRPPLDGEQPWWPYSAQRFVAQHLAPGARVFEFGGGGSTLWLGPRTSEVVCVEHNPDWFDALQTVVAPHVRLIMAPPMKDGLIPSEAEEGVYFDDYVKTICAENDQSFDLVIVDGRARLACLTASLDKVRRGGMLLLDDSDRPRYRRAHEEVTWPRRHLRGLKPGVRHIAQTTVFVRPV